MRHSQKVCLIVPAYNEADSIGHVIQSIHKSRVNYDVVVIDDGSTDTTAQKASQLGVTVITLPFNLGIGGAVQTGLKFARDNGYRIAVQIDADGQHLASEIPRLLAGIDDSTDLVIGSRYFKKTLYQGRWYRTLGIRFFSVLIDKLIGLKIYDPSSGFRAYNFRAIEFLANHYPIDFPEPESIVSLHKNGLTIKEVSVEMRPRMAGKSSILGFKAAYFVISITIGIVLSSLRSKIDSNVTNQ